MYFHSVSLSVCVCVLKQLGQIFIEKFCADVSASRTQLKYLEFWTSATFICHYSKDICFSTYMARHG